MGKIGENLGIFGEYYDGLITRKIVRKMIGVKYDTKVLGLSK